MYKILVNGSLEVLGTGYITTSDGGAPGGTPGVIKVHPSGNYAFVYNYGVSMNISRYQIDSTGILTFQDSINTISATLSRMVIDNSGTYLYWVSNNGGGSDYFYQVGINGTLDIK